MAGTSANRTQQPQDRYGTDGFEDRENHQALSAPTNIAIFIISKIVKKVNAGEALK
jgi:hypothetical protein